MALNYFAPDWRADFSPDSLTRHGAIAVELAQFQLDITPECPGPVDPKSEKGAGCALLLFHRVEKFYLMGPTNHFRARFRHWSASCNSWHKRPLGVVRVLCSAITCHGGSYVEYACAATAR